MKNPSHILEITSMFLAGLSMMLLIVVSAVAIGSTIVDSRRVASGLVESAPKLSLTFDELSSVSNQFAETTGAVAGVVDDSSTNEQTVRNDAAAWLSQARLDSRLNTAYRDEILDRRAQNHARLLAETCSDSRYNEWQDIIGQAVSEGYVTTFSEAIFGLENTDLASSLPIQADDYPRLFTDYKAYGVGVARTSGACSFEYIATFHLAGVQ